MDKEMQIEEMAKVICRRFHATDDVTSRDLARVVYNADYRKQSKWISVEERLPDNYQEVLVYRGCHKGLMNVYTYTCNNQWEDEYGYWNGTDSEGITHWMPLPMPPTEKENTNAPNI